MKTTVTMTVDELATKLHERVMSLYSDPVAVGRATRGILTELDPSDRLAVEGVAAEVAEAMAAEYRHRDDDMISVARRQSAMHAALIEWLAR